VLKCVEAAVMTGADRVVRRHPEKVSLRRPRDLPGLTGRHGYTIVYRVQGALKADRVLSGVYFTDASGRVWKRYASGALTGPIEYPEGIVEPSLAG
jgi:hypothetical protein